MARLCLDGVYTGPFPIECWLPQGSPASLILFLLYMEPLLRLSRGHFEYADDVAILASANSVAECHAKLQTQLDKTVSWEAENGIKFDYDKTEHQ